jgi:hypothetical protein
MSSPDEPCRRAKPWLTWQESTGFRWSLESEFAQHGMQMPTRPDKVREMISIIMETVFGPVEPLALQEIVPVHNKVHVSVHVIRPSESHPHLTLFTTGMSNAAMKVPPSGKEYRYAELIMHLPPSWPHPREHDKDPAAFWPVQWLRQIAYYPHLNGTWLGGPLTIISSDEPPVPLGPNTKHSCLLLMAEAGNFPALNVGSGKIVHVYTVNTLYTEERDYEKKHGWKKLFELLAKHGVTNTVDPKRKNALQAKSPRKAR